MLLPALYHWSPVERRESIRTTGLHPYSPPTLLRQAHAILGRGLADPRGSRPDRADLQRLRERPDEVSVLMVECTCKITGPAPEQTRWDKACPYHGDNGTMVAVVKLPKPKAGHV